jgi:hypothetical protein
MADRRSQCKQADQWIQKALDAALTPAERDALDRHMETCSACAQAWQQHRALSQLATDWARRPSLNQEGTDEFIAKLMTSIESRPARGILGSRSWGAALAFAGALALLAIISWFLAPSLPALSAVWHPLAITPLRIAPDSTALLPHSAIQSVRDWVVQGAQSLPTTSAAGWNALTAEPISVVPAVAALAAGMLLAALLAAQSAPRRRLN